MTTYTYPIDYFINNADIDFLLGVEDCPRLPLYLGIGEGGSRDTILQTCYTNEPGLVNPGVDFALAVKNAEAATAVLVVWAMVVLKTYKQTPDSIDPESVLLCLGSLVEKMRTSL